MADTLKFRGGSTSDIASSTVSDREIIFDTDKNTLVLGSAKDYLMRYGGNSQSGNVGIGVASPSTALDVSGTVTATAFAGPVTGNLTGNVTGNVTGNLTGDVTGNLTGNVTGPVTGNLTGNVTGPVTGNLTGNVTGNLTGDVTGNVTGNLTGNVTNDTVIISAGSTERLRIDSAGRLLVGTSSGRKAGSAFGPYSPTIQVEAAAGAGSLQVYTGILNRADSLGPEVVLAKTRSGSAGNSTIVQNNDSLGSFVFAGADGVDIESIGARIEAFVDGTPGENDMPGRLTFSTTADGASTPTERMRIDSSGRLLVGTSASIGVGSTTPAQFQISAASGQINAALYGLTDSAFGSVFVMGHGRGTTSGALLANDTLGEIRFAGADGTDLQSLGATIKAQVDGTPGENDMPGRLTFSTTADGASTPTERMRIVSSGNVGIGTSNPQTKLAVNGTVGLGSTTHFTNNLRDSQTIFDRSPQLQINSTNGPGSSIGLISWHSSESGFYSPQLWLAKSNGSVGSNVRVTDNTDLGTINFAGNDGSSFLNAGSIRAEVDGTPGTNNMPGRLVLSTTASGSSSPTERVTIDNAGRLLVGTSSELSVNGITAGVEVHGTATNNGASISIARFRDDISAPVLSFGKSRNTSIGPGTIVQSQDVLGQIAFSGDDGAGLNTPIARIDSLVDGNPLQTGGTVRIPACLTFSTASNVGGLAERVRITGSGSLQIHQTTSNTPGFNNTTTGSSIEKSGGGSALFVSRSDNATAYFNRNSDGNLVRFFRSGTQVGRIDVTTSTSAFVGTSDYRLKENITDLSNGIDRLKLLTPRRFNFIAEPDQTIDGFIAHEMQTAVPEAVFGEKDAMEDQEFEVTPAVLDEDGNVTTEAVVETRSVISPQGIDQSKLVPLLTAALQEAIAKIEVLEQRLSDAGIA